MYCEYCGKPATIFVKYCRYCGAKLEYYKDEQPQEEQQQEEDNEA